MRSDTLPGEVEGEENPPELRIGRRRRVEELSALINAEMKHAVRSEPGDYLEEVDGFMVLRRADGSFVAAMPVEVYEDGRDPKSTTYDAALVRPLVDAPPGLPVPRCNEQCPSHDGQRCRLMGFRPDGICEPAVVELIETRDGALAEIAELRDSVEAKLFVLKQYEQRIDELLAKKGQP